MRENLAANPVLVLPPMVTARRLVCVGRRPQQKIVPVEGLPIKMVVHRKGENLPIMTTAVVRVEAKSLAASLFEVPSTYKKENVISLLATPEMAEKMQNFVDKTTPAQRKLYENMEGPHNGEIARRNEVAASTES